MKIYLIRHGETKESVENIILGSIGGELNDNGIKYSQKIANFFNNNNIFISKIITSDLNRAYQTAKIISQKLNIPIEIEKLVRERSAGDIEGKKESEVNWITYESKTLENRKHLNGKSFQEVKIFFKTQF